MFFHSECLIFINKVFNFEDISNKSITSVVFRIKDKDILGL